MPFRSPIVIEALHAWQAADAQACEIDHRLAAVWRAFDEGDGERPTPELMEEAGRLHAFAKEKLAELMHARAEAVHHAEASGAHAEASDAHTQDVSVPPDGEVK
jgi:hypothetical protein